MLYVKQHCMARRTSNIKGLGPYLTMGDNAISIRFLTNFQRKIHVCVRLHIWPYGYPLGPGKPNMHNPYIWVHA